MIRTIVLVFALFLANGLLFHFFAGGEAPWPRSNRPAWLMRFIHPGWATLVSPIFMMVIGVAATVDSAYPYLLALTVPFGSFVSANVGFFWAQPINVVILMPFLEWAIGSHGGAAELTREQVQVLKRSARFKWITAAWVPLQVGMLLWSCSAVAAWTLTPLQLVGFAVLIGQNSGGMGFAVAHELIHRAAPWERLCGRVLLISVAYPHWEVEHLRGHHARVATEEDPATARLGESFYSFYPRTVAGTWQSAWALERVRLKRRGLPVWSRHNIILTTWTATLLLATGILVVWGWRSLLFFVIQAFVAFSSLELMNYVQHWGLSRRRLEDGSYAPVSHAHSWNSDLRLSDYYLFNLQRHSDHHEKPGLRYQALSAAANSPQLPFGYAAAMALALLPPVWKWVMGPRVAAVAGLEGQDKKGSRRSLQ